MEETNERQTKINESGKSEDNKKGKTRIIVRVRLSVRVGWGEWGVK